MKRLRKAPVLLGLVLACAGGDDQPVAGEAEPTACVEDPIARLVSPNECTGDLDCPSGTHCEESTGVCVRPTGDFATDATLTSGFNVPRFDLDRTQAGSFSFNMPDSAEVVVCALFRCPPAFEAQPGGGVFIANFDVCVAAYDTYTEQDSKLVLSLLERHEGAATEAEACEDLDHDAAETLGRPRPIAFWTGCWAYGTTSLIRASRFRSLLPEDLEGAPIKLWSSCPGTLDDPTLDKHDACETGEESNPYGACVDGTCRPWCTVDADCPARPFNEWNCDEGSCEITYYDCEIAEDDLLGLCEPPPP